MKSLVSDSSMPELGGFNTHIAREHKQAAIWRNVLYAMDGR